MKELGEIDFVSDFINILVPFQWVLKKLMKECLLYWVFFLEETSMNQDDCEEGCNDLVVLDNCKEAVIN